MSTKAYSGLGLGTEGQKAERTVRDFEKEVRDDSIENILIMDRNGNIIERNKGTEEEVSYNTPIEKMKDMITSHNHPDIILPDGSKIQGNIFSPEDIESFADNDEFACRVVTGMRTYILRRADFNDSGGRHLLAKAYAAAFEKAEEKAMKVADKYTAMGKVKDDESSWLRFCNLVGSRYMRRWLRREASKYGYVFEEHLRGRK